ncbi:tRNA splicing 2 phosphotransferase 1 [Grosmannia clavigera kw1407]|uniref:2'-phosphotransferase n=1 Tax=Grosmannia clavigera (strain kw1407 / UAMH 11150) TaxID=655863 RepID=F0XQ55_GROCL|nr:tRNA splicing 2 phosphotransferase 1 [Grosmannia clavigera kw1407]EFX00142.1 tRNA splicing 2 phosphotransferase 1 [Grosmannia clavigera kw1407]
MDEMDSADVLAAQFADRLSEQGKHSAGGQRGGSSRRRGGGNGRGKREGGSSSSRAVDVSRALSKLLRHQATSAGIVLDGEGYAALDQVLAWGPLRSMGVTAAEVRDVVASNEKQRFGMKRVDGDGIDEVEADIANPSAWRIRANQGHSLPLASDGGLLQAIVDVASAPAIVCHGTFVAAWPQIEASGGLRPMGRNHVHCGSCEGGEGEADMDADADADLDTARLARTIPGLRKNADLLVFLDVRRALCEDPSIRWWRSDNGVVLTEGNADGVVPARFFRRVVTTAAPTLVLWRDGHRTSELPAALLARARMPGNMRGAAVRARAKDGSNNTGQQTDRGRTEGQKTDGEQTDGQTE